MIRLKYRSSVVLLLVLSACASAPKKAAEPVIGVPAPVPKINYEEVQNKIGVDMSPSDTGIREKVFDACDLGPALAELKEPLKDCHKAYFSLIQFSLACRPTEQPDGVLGADDLTPVRNQHIKWNVGEKITGELETNFDGRGVIRVISPKSQKRSFVRVSTGIDFLFVRANEVTDIVVTPSWCGR